MSQLPSLEQSLAKASGSKANGEILQCFFATRWVRARCPRTSIQKICARFCVRSRLAVRTQFIVLAGTSRAIWATAFSPISDFLPRMKMMLSAVQAAFEAIKAVSECHSPERRRVSCRKNSVPGAVMPTEESIYDASPSLAYCLDHSAGASCRFAMPTPRGDAHLLRPAPGLVPGTRAISSF